jgi:hypothetical protein
MAARITGEGSTQRNAVKLTVGGQKEMVQETAVFPGNGAQLYCWAYVLRHKKARNSLIYRKLEPK